MIYFIGAGPGDPELLTLKAQRLITSCEVLLYAGSLIPKTIIEMAARDTQIFNSAEMHLEEITAICLDSHHQGKSVARLQCGDPSFYSAIGEQIQALQQHDIPFEVVPGVTAASASAASLACELTLPQVTQTVIYTRYAGKTPFPEKEKLPQLAQHGATLVIHLGLAHIHKICAELAPHYGYDCPVAVVYKASWPEEKIIRGELQNIVEKVRAAKITRTATIIVSKTLDANQKVHNSYLYDKEQAHIFRPKYKRS